jgi:hypothetical protein
MTRTEASMYASIAANERWARTSDRTAATAPARAGLDARFEAEVDPNGTLDPAERAKRIAAKRRAYFKRLALRSAQSRRQAADARRAASEYQSASQSAAQARQTAAELRRAADELENAAAMGTSPPGRV